MDSSERFETAYETRDLFFFDSTPQEELNRHNCFLSEIGKRRWDAAIVHPKVQACPYWAWVIKNQFTIWQGTENYVEDAHYLFSYCPESRRREAVTRVYRYYHPTPDHPNPEDVTAFVEAHKEYLDHSLGNLGDVACNLKLTRHADGGFTLQVVPGVEGTGAPSLTLNVPPSSNPHPTSI